MKFTLQFDDSALKGLKSQIEGMRHTAKVGLINGGPMAFIGRIHEFGASVPITDASRAWWEAHVGGHKSDKPITIPERSFLRLPMAMKEMEFRQTVAAAAKSIGHAKDLGRKIIKQAAIAYTALVKECFYTGGWGTWEPLHAVTKLLRKAGDTSKPLMDTTELVRAIKYKVEK